MLLSNKLSKDQKRNVLVVYPGRFHPFHKGHKAVFDGLCKQYGRDQVFIATSNKTEPVKSPFSFSDKMQFMSLSGIDTDRIVETTQPYRAPELVSRYDAKTTHLILVVSQKDMNEDARFASWTKKDGNPTYFQPMPANTDNMSVLEQHGYILTVPTTEFSVLGKPMLSATQVRDKFAQANLKTQKAIIKDLFGNYNDEVLQIMQIKLTG